MPTIHQLRADECTPPLVFNVEEQAQLKRYVDEGYIRLAYHPNNHLVIWNYDKKALHQIPPAEWTPVLSACRGLITDRISGRVKARSFPKFWNAPDKPELPKGYSHWVVQEKIDGYLGIVWHRFASWEEWARRWRENPGTDWGVASRGSFTSDYAKEALRILLEHLNSLRVSHILAPPEGHTPVVEVISKKLNFIVPYKRKESLTLIGLVENRSGTEVLPIPPGILGLNSVQEYDMTPADAMADQRSGIEGYVLVACPFDQLCTPPLRMKVKTDWYKSCVRAVVHLSPYKVAKALQNGTENDLLEALRHSPSAVAVAQQELYDISTKFIVEYVRISKKLNWLLENEGILKLSPRYPIPTHCRKAIVDKLHNDPDRAAVLAALNDRERVFRFWIGKRMSLEEEANSVRAHEKLARIIKKELTLCASHEPIITNVTGLAEVV